MASTIHPTALLLDVVTFGEDVDIGPFAVLGRRPMRSAALVRSPQESLPPTAIGNRVCIGVGAIVFAGVSIDDDTLVGDQASIREGASIGKRCVIGRQVTINYGARIGNDCRFQDGTHITGDIIIGDGCFFGPNVSTANDSRVDLQHYGWNGDQPPIVGNRVMVGTGAVIIPGVRIGDDAVIAAGAIVAKDVPPGVTVKGQRAQIVRSALQTSADRLSDAALLLDLCPEYMER